MSGGMKESLDDNELDDNEFLEEYIKAVETYSTLDKDEFVKKLFLGETDIDEETVKNKIAEYRTLISLLKDIDNGLDKEVAANLYERLNIIEEDLSTLYPSIEAAKEKSELAEEAKEEAKEAAKKAAELEESIKTLQYLHPIHSAARTLQAIITGSKTREKVAEKNRRNIEGSIVSLRRHTEKAEYDKKTQKMNKKKPEYDSSNSDWSDE